MKSFLKNLFLISLEHALPRRCLPGCFPEPPDGELALLALGKAGAAMALAAIQNYDAAIEGIVLVPDGHAEGIDLPGCLRVMESSHPVPDERSVSSADAALALVRRLTPGDLLLALVSGGGSSVMCKPIDGTSLAAKQELNRQMQASGASIAEINHARCRLSAVKGGKLVADSKAPVVSLVISDVPGDDPALVASGPTIATRATAVSDSWSRIVASGDTMLKAARAQLEARAYRVLDLGDRVEGEARQMAGYHARMAARVAGDSHRSAILSGGETTVTLDAGCMGSGGRNTEYLLALALELNGHPDVWAIACDSDGLDGNGGHAGAVIGPDTLNRAAQLELDPAASLAAHDSAGFFDQLGDLVFTGPTHTNVNDFRAIVVAPGEP